MSTIRVTPDAKVREMVYRYRPLETLHPTLYELFDVPEFEQMFNDCLNHDLNLIRGRSQDLADSEITITQKAFKILMDDKKDEVAGIGLYVNEILGLQSVPGDQQVQVIGNALKTRDYVLSHGYGRDNQASSTSAIPGNLVPSKSRSYGSQPSELTYVSGNASYSNNEHLHSQDSGFSQFSELPPAVIERGEKSNINDTFVKPRTGSDGNEMFEKLFIIYENAKKDFKLLPRKSQERTKSAKFLRDTIENCLAYLANREMPSFSNKPQRTSDELRIHNAKVEEMKSSLKEAIDAAEEGYGGKKRRFDEDWTEIPEAPATMRSSLPVTPPRRRDPVPRGTYAEQRSGGSSAPRPVQKQISPARRVNKVDRTPRGLIPASAGQGTRRVYPLPTLGDDKRTARPGYSDCYRPSYR